jgi:acyl-coenzyme A synthetase/AMP-(fatty) acid ligase
MVPKEIHVLETMPYNVNGKIDRLALQRLLATPKTVD